MKKLVLIILMTGWSWNIAEASDLGVKEYGLTGGWLLPDQLPGMKDILPTWGVHAGYGLAPQGMILLGYGSSLAKGVKSHQVDLSWRQSAAMDGVIGYLALGLSLIHYNSYLLESAQQELGVALGTGFMFQLSQEVWFRSEMRFRAEPGVQMQLLIGLVLRL